MNQLVVNNQPVDSVIIENGKDIDKQAPLILSIPHSGECYPDDFFPNHELSFAVLDHPNDKFVDQLYGARNELNIASVQANFPRSYIDVNRHQHDIDLDMLAEEGKWYGRAQPTGLASGTTLFWSRTKEIYQVYNRKLSHAELKNRIATCFVPYHQSLTQLIETARMTHGCAYVIDCHSMTQYDTKKRGGKQRPAVDLGDRNGNTCSTEYLECVADSYSDQGFDVTVNGRFAGGEIVLRYGWPEIEQHILQVEIRRDLYMDEELRARNEHFNDVQQKCSAVLAQVKAYAKQKSANF